MVSHSHVLWSRVNSITGTTSSQQMQNLWPPRRDSPDSVSHRVWDTPLRHTGRHHHTFMFSLTPHVRS